MEKLFKSNNTYLVKGGYSEQHPFWVNALVLAIDIGLEGIGICLRKGKEILFARTFLVNTPEAAPLATRRQKRAARRARHCRKRRDNMLYQWILRHILISEEKLKTIWNDSRIFKRVYEHRYRGLSGKLASPEALIACLRHGVRHRGYDYHLLGEEAGDYPGCENFAELKNWIGNAFLTKDFAKEKLDEIRNNASWVFDEKGHVTKSFCEIEKLFQDKAAKQEEQTILKMLKTHLIKKHHNHLRQPARGKNFNFPREEVKEHLYQICEQHKQFFKANQFEPAMRELLGERDGNKQWTCKKLDFKGELRFPIIDYHRKDLKDAEALWLKKTKKCFYAEKLWNIKDLEHDKNSHPSIRRFFLLQFLTERGVETKEKRRIPIPDHVIKALIQDYLETDIKAVGEKAPRPRAVGIKEMEKLLGLKLESKKQSSFNENFFDQFSDLIKPDLRKLKQRAGLSGKAAEHFYQLATRNGIDFDPEGVKQRLSDYYFIRKNRQPDENIYSQVDFLLGQMAHYDEQGNPKDFGRKDGQPQHHGILRRLFHQQLKLDTDESINLKDKLDGKTEPDYVIIETIGDMPRDRDERKELQTKQQQHRKHKREILEKYGLQNENLSESEIKQVLLFDQQTNKEGKEAFCPYTGESLGENPLDHKLEVEHIFPASRGGISDSSNLCVTTHAINKAKDKRTPVEIAGKFLEGVKFLSLDEMKSQIQSFRWNKAKQTIFLWDQEGVPPFENLTRVSQLARHLREAVIRWLGIRKRFEGITDLAERENAISKEIAKRIGTPTGYLTAVCRESWKDKLPDKFYTIAIRDGKDVAIKNRDNLRHHLWDAIVLSHIPPGVGMTHESYGGIFYREDNSSQKNIFKLRTLPEFAPDVAAYEKQHAEKCLVHKLRAEKSKTSRTQETIYGIRDEQARSLSKSAEQINQIPDYHQKLWVREPLFSADSKNNYLNDDEKKKIEKKLENCGIEFKKLSKVKEWVKANGSKRLTLSDGTPVDSIPTKAREAQTSSLAGHYSQNKLAGFKVFTEAYLKKEIWENSKIKEKERTKKDYFSRLIPHPRNLASLRRRGECLPIPNTPSGYEKVGDIKKGDLLRVPLDYHGDFCDPNEKTPYCWLWYRVTVLGSKKQMLSKGQVFMKLAEFKEGKNCPVKKLEFKPLEAEVLAKLLKLSKQKSFES